MNEMFVGVPHYSSRMNHWVFHWLIVTTEKIKEHITGRIEIQTGLIYLPINKSINSFRSIFSYLFLFITNTKLLSSMFIKIR